VEYAGQLCLVPTARSSLYASARVAAGSWCKRSGPALRPRWRAARDGPGGRRARSRSAIRIA